MNVALWVVQSVLAVLYTMAGLWKVSGQEPVLVQAMPDLSIGLIRTVGVLEAVAALGLVLPVIARDKIAVAGWAGALLSLEAALFAVYHVRHHAYAPAGATVVLGLLAAFVSWGRTK